MEVLSRRFKGTLSRIRIIRESRIFPGFINFSQAPGQAEPQEGWKYDELQGTCKKESQLSGI